VTSPRASGEPGGEESPAPAEQPGPPRAEEPRAEEPTTQESASSEPDSAGHAEPGHRGPGEQGHPEQGHPEPGEQRATPGIRWSDPAAGGPAAPDSSSDDPTPPTGTAAPGPGDVVPERTTGTAPTPAPSAAWPHPAYQPGPPTWPQTAPAWAPAAATAPPDPARRRRIRRIVLLVVLALVVIAAIVVALLAFLVGPRFARYDVLDHAAVERGVSDVVTRDWHRQITNVVCPDGERVRPGVSFTCSATVDGRPQQVPVDVVDENGGYEVGQPR
jgi:hypothetical protein